MLNVPRASIRRTALLLGAILWALASCSTAPLEPYVQDAKPTPASQLPAAPTTTGVIARSNSRWVPARWSELPGWDAERGSEFWPSLVRSCERPSAEWTAVCTQVKAAVTPAFSDDAARAWVQQHLQPYRIESLEGVPDGLMTGYFEPLVQASRMPHGDFRIALYAPPLDLSTRKPYWTRQQIDVSPAAQASLRGRALAYVSDPLDALILQIQGSGRLDLSESDGSHKLVRVAFAGHNDQPYKSVGRWLIDQGELTPLQASWPAIKNWARMNPKRLNEMLWSNPRVIFFREEPLPDPQLGPKGAQGVALTPGRSIAVDAQSIPYGTPVWIDTTEPLSMTPLRRLVMAQDTGTAITGAVRADYFWGWGPDAEAQAGRMKQPLRLWALWPRG